MPRVFSCRVVAASIALFGATCFGQPEEMTPEDLLSDFIHYTKIHQFEVARAMGQDLLSRGMTPEEFVDLVEDSPDLSRFMEAVADAQRVAELEEISGALRELYEDGKLDRARNPSEIAANIALLTTNARGRLIGRERLVEAGEYAMPQLLDAFLQRENPALQAQVRRLLVDMGRQSIIPLVTTLPHLDPARQEQIVDVLGLIEYNTSLPFLFDLLRTTNVEEVRVACRRAIERRGNPSLSTDLASLYLMLGERYYEERSELTSFPGEEHQLLWEYDPGIGLIMKPIRTEVFHEARAMAMAEQALRHGAAGGNALGLWVSSNFSREIDTGLYIGEDYENPAYPSSDRDAMYFAVSVGSGICQEVLGRAIDTRDTPLARRAIAAIERTAGGEAMSSARGNRLSLIEALSFPNRRVQYEASLALGKAGIQSSFTNSERVVPLLSSAIRNASSRYAVVIASDREDGQSLSNVLRAAGYTVLPPATNLNDVREPIAEAPGIDLVVTSLSTAAAQDVISEVRGSTKMAASPVLVLLNSLEYTQLWRRYDRDVSVSVRQRGITDAQLSGAVEELVVRAAGGPILAEEARSYASRSIDVLRDLAISDNPVFSVRDATTELIEALSEIDGPMRLDVAEVLSHIDEPRAQVALADAALTSSGSEQLSLMGSLSGSAKRHGNHLVDRQVRRFVGLAQDADDDLATAAAALVGALNLPNDALLPLILGDR